MPASDHVFAESLSTGRLDRLTVEEILEGAQPRQSEEPPATVERPDVSDFSEKEWFEARRPFKIIDALVDRDDLGRADVEAKPARLASPPARSTAGWATIAQSGTSPR